MWCRTWQRWRSRRGLRRNRSSHIRWRTCAASWRTAAGMPNGARWAVALALGLRQGEVLGLRWRDVDLDSGVMSIRVTRLRPVYAHGCVTPCARPAGRCPERVRVNGDIGPTKSNAGRRVIGLPAPLVALLHTHRDEQDLDRARARQLWTEGDWVFTTKTGQPLNPNSDYHAWKALVKRAGVRDARLHDARHTAATVLLVLGVPERTVMEVMGWSTTAMAARYQHVTDPIRREVAARVGALLWQVETTTETTSETNSPDASGGFVPSGASGLVSGGGGI